MPSPPRAAPSLRGRRACWAEALALWRGPALAEFGEEPFARVEAARLEDLRLAALEERIEADLALGRHAELVGELEALIAEHPHRERLRGQLMLALYRSRQAGGGARGLPRGAGRARRARARAGRGAPAARAADPDPGRGARAAARAAARRRGRVAARAARAGAAVPVRRPRERAGDAARAARAGRGRRGRARRCSRARPAAGKTRLVRELAHEAAARGVLVLYGASDAAVSTPLPAAAGVARVPAPRLRPRLRSRSASATRRGRWRGSCPSSRA